MRKLYLLGAAVATTVAFAGAASAQVIADWDNFGQPGDQAFTPPNSAAANVSGMNMARGPGLNASAAANSISSSGWNTLSADDYFTFGFTVDAGWSVDLDELWIGTRSSNTGPGFLGLFYSGDSFTNNLFTFVQSGTDFNNSIIDLSALTGLTGAVEFRIMALNNTSAGGGTIGGGGTLRLGDHFADGDFTNIQFTGSVIPTPGAVALLGIAGVAGLRRRRA